MVTAKRDSLAANRSRADSFREFLVSECSQNHGEAPHYPTSARVVRNWFAPKDRGVLVGLFNAASPLGTALAPPLLTFLMITFNWRWMFVVMGAVGLIAVSRKDAKAQRFRRRQTISQITKATNRL